MTFLFAFIGGLVGAVVGAVGFGVLFYIVSGAIGMSDFEGERAMTSAFLAGPVGGLAGLVLGVVLVLRLRKKAPQNP